MAGSLTLPAGLAGIGAAVRGTRLRPHLRRPPVRPAMALYGGALAIALVAGGLDAVRSRANPPVAPVAVAVDVAGMQAQAHPPVDASWNPRPAALGLAVEAEGLIRTLGSVDEGVEATAIAQLLADADRFEAALGAPEGTAWGAQHGAAAGSLRAGLGYLRQGATQRDAAYLARAKWLLRDAFR